MQSVDAPARITMNIPPLSFGKVSGNSMLPVLKPGSHVAFAPGIGTLREGDVVAFRCGGRLVVHRVVSVTSQGLVTQGDNRGVRDKRLVSLDQVEGRALLVRQAGGSWRRITAPPGGSWWRNRLGLRLRNYFCRASDACRTVFSMNDERFEKQKLGRDVVVHDRSTGQVHVLNETASLAWEKFNEGLGINEVETLFGQLYPEASPEEIAGDVHALHSDLLERGLIDTKKGRPLNNE